MKVWMSYSNLRIDPHPSVDVFRQTSDRLLQPLSWCSCRWRLDYHSHQQQHSFPACSEVTAPVWSWLVFGGSSQPTDCGNGPTFWRVGAPRPLFTFFSCLDRTYLPWTHGPVHAAAFRVCKETGGVSTGLGPECDIATYRWGEGSPGHWFAFYLGYCCQ